MKNAGLLIILFLASLMLFSQTPSEKIIYIEVSCGFGAKTSNEIINYRTLLKSNEYELIKYKLVKGTPMEQVLSTISIQELELIDKITLTPEEREIMNLIINSRRKYSVCFTCTLQIEGTLKQMFSKKKKTFESAYEIIRYGLFLTK